MTDRIAVPVAGLGVLLLERDVLDAALAAGAELSAPIASPPGPAGPRLLTSEQLGEQLSIPATWLEEAARRDEIPSVRIGKYVRFDVDEVMSSLNPRIAGVRGIRKRPLQQPSSPVQIGKVAHSVTRSIS